MVEFHQIKTIPANLTQAHLSILIWNAVLITKRRNGDSHLLVFFTSKEFIKCLEFKPNQEYLC